MALADYTLCAVCEQKAFYDATLNYQCIKSPDEPQLTDLTGNKCHIALDRAAQMAALCHECFGNGFRLKVSKADDTL